ncbi:MAG: hypothetical protein WDM90_13865 [Ferruginibacter sp.]
MKYNFLKLTAIILCTAIIISSCGKDDANAVATTNTSLLTSNCWKPTSIKIDVTDNNSDADAVESIDPSNLDNRVCFNANGTTAKSYGINRNPAAAVPDNPTDETGNWVWQNGNTQFLYTVNSIPSVINVLQLDATHI